MNEKIHYELSRIHNRANGFDVDLFAIDKVWRLDSGEVTFAQRIFRIPSPKWLQRFVFGEVIL
jgi:hypothetical protein